jgi:putative membrane protein
MPVYNGVNLKDLCMADDHDPRVYFAAERTLLAWVRTGLATIGLGFVVARFGLFLRMLRTGPDAPTHLGSTLIGVGLVVLGSVAMGLAAWQHGQFRRRLPPGELPQPYFTRWSAAFAAILAIIGFALAAYLTLRSNLPS